MQSEFENFFLPYVERTTSLRKPTNEYAENYKSALSSYLESLALNRVSKNRLNAVNALGEKRRGIALGTFKQIYPLVCWGRLATLEYPQKNVGLFGHLINDKELYSKLEEVLNYFSGDHLCLLAWILETPGVINNLTRSSDLEHSMWAARMHYANVGYETMEIRETKALPADGVHPLVSIKEFTNKHFTPYRILYESALMHLVEEDRSIPEEEKIYEYDIEIQEHASQIAIQLLKNTHSRVLTTAISNKAIKDTEIARLQASSELAYAHRHCYEAAMEQIA